jgi:hypothetical protein
LKKERARIDAALNALEGLGAGGKARTNPTTKKTRKPMSAAVKAKIRKAALKRWAAQKKKA